VTRAKYLVFRFLYWLLYRRDTRARLAAMVEELDQARSAEFQPLTGKQKVRAGFFLARELFDGKKNADKKAIRGVEWAVQAARGREHQSSRMNEGGLAWFYKKANRTEDKDWNITRLEQAYQTRRLIRAIHKERQHRRMADRTTRRKRKA